MSAYGTKRTSLFALHMSAFGCKADIGKPTSSAFEPPTALRRRYLQPQMLPRHRMPSLPMDCRFIQSAPSRPHTTEGIVRVQESALNYVDEFMKVDRLIS
jgi:hypothetical protein